MIAFACPGCSKSFRVKDDRAGKTSVCPACKKRLVVPLPTATPPLNPESNPFAELKDEESPPPRQSNRGANHKGPVDEGDPAIQFLKKWWMLGAALLLLLAVKVFIALDSPSGSSPEAAYNAGYTWGETIKKQGVNEAWRKYRGTKYHPDDTSFNRRADTKTAYHWGLQHGLEGADRHYLEIYSYP